MTNANMFFKPADYAVFEYRLASNPDYDAEREHIREKLITLHKSIFPEMRKCKWNVHPHWMSQWLVSAARISPATSRIDFMTLRYSKPEALIKLMKKELIEDLAHFYANAMLAARIDQDGFSIELLVSEKAWVDGQNLKNRLLSSAQQRAQFRSMLAELGGEHTLSLSQFVREDGRPTTYQQILRAKASRLVNAGVFDSTMDKYKPGGQDLRLGIRYTPDDKRLGCEHIVGQVLNRFEQLYPLYAFLCWSPDNDYRVKKDANKKSPR